MFFLLSIRHSIHHFSRIKKAAHKERLDDLTFALVAYVQRHSFCKQTTHRILEWYDPFAPLPTWGFPRLYTARTPLRATLFLCRESHVPFRRVRTLRSILVR